MGLVSRVAVLPVALAAALTLAASHYAAAQFGLVGTLHSVTVAPAAPSIGVGQQQSFGATGNFEGGMRQLGGNGSSPMWHVRFSPSLDASACLEPPQPTSLCCQGNSVQSDGTFNSAWGGPPVVQSTGLLTPATYHADLSCISPPPGAPTGTIDAYWTGTQYDGDFNFGNTGLVSVVGLAWSSSDPSVASVDARGVATAIAPGTTIITAIFGATCWPGEPGTPDSCRGTVAGTATLTVTDVACPPPSIDSVQASPSVLWPPNHKLVPVTLSASVSNSCSRPVSCRIVSVTSSEPADAAGDGRTEPDWVPTGDRTVLLRAERQGGGAGRLYTIVFECTNGSDSSRRAVVVSVPHNR